jgi:hypothetical protein
MCETCDPFFLPVPVGTQAAYRAQLARLRLAERDDCLALVESSTPWPLPEAGPLPPAARHLFSCQSCAQLFILERGGCSALGDQWRPLHGN